MADRQEYMIDRHKDRLQETETDRQTDQQWQSDEQTHTYGKEIKSIQAERNRTMNGDIDLISRHYINILHTILTQGSIQGTRI